MPGAAERLDAPLQRGVLFRTVPEVDEQAVLPVDRRIAQGLVRDRKEPGAGLSRALRDELLEPHPQRGDGLRDEECHLVAPLTGQLAHHRAERYPWVVLDRDAGRARMRHVERPGQHPGDIDPHERRRHQPKVGESRVPAADIGEVEEHPAIPAALALVHERRCGIADGHEVLPGSISFERPELRVEVLAECGRFGRRSGLARDDEQGLREGDGVLHREDRRGIGGIEHGHGQPAGRLGKRTLEHQGRQAAASHPHVDDMAESVIARVRAKPGQGARLLQESERLPAPIAERMSLL